MKCVIVIKQKGTLNSKTGHIYLKGNVTSMEDKTGHQFKEIFYPNIRKLLVIGCISPIG